MYYFGLVVIFYFIFNSLNGQTVCYNMAVQGWSNTGCTNGCNLSEFSGLPNPCTSSSSAGSASSISFTLGFTISAGCNGTLTAYYGRRCNGNDCGSCSSCSGMSSSNGCCNSGLDGGDKLVVGGSGGTGVTLTHTLYNNSSGGMYTFTCGIGTASANATVTSSSITAEGANNGGARIRISQTGGQVFVSGTTNRADEIVTFTFTIQSGCNCSNVLPVSLSYFTGRLKNNAISLHWKTTEESNISRFLIEKYFESEKEFKAIGYLEAKNKPLSDYEFLDNQPFEGGNYYRLSVVDMNERIEKFFYYSINFSRFFANNFITNNGDKISWNKISEVSNCSEIIIYSVDGKVLFQTNSPYENVEFIPDHKNVLLLYKIVINGEPLFGKIFH